MFKKINEIREKYYHKISAIACIVLFLLLILSEFFPTLRLFLIDKGVLSYIILLFLLDVVNYLVKFDKEMKEKQRTKFYPSQDEAIEDVIRYIRLKKPSKVDLIEYSSGTILLLLQNLKRVKCQIRLLIKHPDTSISDFQRKKICQRIRELIGVDFKNYRKVEIRCYKQFASLRGRKFDDDFISIGWYTPTIKVEGEILGHGNPMINAYIEDESGKVLKKIFDDVFNVLWDGGVPVEEVLQES